MRELPCDGVSAGVKFEIENLFTTAHFEIMRAVNNFSNTRNSRVGISSITIRISPGGEQLGAYHFVHDRGISGSLITVH